MTKQQILDEVSIRKHSCYFEISLVRCKPEEIQEIYSEAMDEYAKQEAVAFAEWTNENYIPTTNNKWQERKIATHKGFIPIKQWNDSFKTTSELYSLFKQEGGV